MIHKTVLITGASSGIGEALAWKYAEEGYRLILIARREERLVILKQDIEKKYGGHVFNISCDLSLPDSVHNIYNIVKKENIAVDVLINNAGFGHYGAFCESSVETMTKMIQVNTMALMQLTHYFAADMVKRQSGHIINVGSIVGFVPGPFMAMYYATKAFVLSFSEALSQELASKNVCVTVFCPGPVASEFKQVAYGVDQKHAMHNTIPSSAKAADTIFYAMQKKQVINLFTFSNHIILLVLRFLPRAVIRRLWRIARKK